MTTQPKVSIIIPLFNSEEYISRTLESCLAQTYQNIEIIIVDDGSTDKSLEVVKRYEKQDSRIKVYTQINSGASVARNKAFSFSSGDFIQYLDADDIIDSDKIRLQIEALADFDNNTISFSKWGCFNNSIKNVVWKYPPVNKNYDDTKQFLVDLWSSGMTVVVHSWLTPRFLVECSGGWNEKVSTNDDGEFFARIVKSANQIIFVEDSIVYYRKDNLQSLSKQVSRKAIQSNLGTFETYVSVMRNNLEDEGVRKSLAYVYSKYLYNLYPEHKDLVKDVKRSLKLLGFDQPIYHPSNRYYLLSKFIGVHGVIRLRKLIGK